MCGEGVVAKIFVGDETHGVAEIEFGDVVRTIRGEDEINTERALVVGYDVEMKPRFEMCTERLGEVDAEGDIVVGKEEVVAIDPTGRFEERIADKEKFMVGDAVFECVGGLDLPARFDNHTTLLSNHFLKPEPVMLGE